MGHIEVSTELSASPDALFATISDTSTWDKWFTVHSRFMEEPPAKLEVGSKLVEKVVMLGMANKLESVITELDAPHVLKIKGTGMAGVVCEFTFSLEAIQTGTKLTVAGDFDGALIKGALGKAVEKDGTKQLTTSLEQLAALATADV